MTELLVDPAGGEEAGAIVLAHGAGAPMDSGFMTLLCAELNRHHITTYRFEFPYMQRRRAEGVKSPPDRQAVLLDAWREAFRRVVLQRGRRKGPLLIGGKSMGGRMASLVADELRPAGFCCFGYPFRAPGKTGKDRTGHFRDLATPGLILQGTRDAFGRSGQVETTGWSPALSLQWLEEGDHDYQTRKRSGLTQQSVVAEAAAHVERFAKRLSDVTAS